MTSPTLVTLGKKRPQDTAPRFLPTTRADLDARGWDALDVLIVTGDAYVDHPAFGPVLIARFLEGRGFRVGVVAQPRWDSPDDIARMGRPRLFVGVAAGNLDSMLNRLTAQKKTRGEDQYTPGGKTEARPNRATLVYSNLCRQAFPGLPIVLGGIEASLRRIAHYDYWSDQVRRSVLLDAKADLLVFGMGERPAWEIARRLQAGEPVSALTDVRGTAHVKKNRREWEPLLADVSRYTTDGKLLVLPSYEEARDDKAAFARMSRLLQYETNPRNGRPMLQPHGDQAVYFNSPAAPLTEAEMDGLYDLPFARLPHPSYTERIPAYETVKHSIVTMRGCFGGCTFCSITEHEGRVIQSRSEESVLREVRALSRMDGYRGVLSDVGGPTANMYKMSCKDEKTEASCRRLSCVYPGICENLVTDHAPLVSLLRKVRAEPTVKKAFIASGVRYDLAERSPEFIRELALHHTGGQLSVAPEHSSDKVLAKMKKPSITSYERFATAFCKASEDAGREQYLVPYFITGHPGSTLADTVELALYLKKHGMRPRQVQDFIPTPMAIATTMFYTGTDPLSGEPVYTATDMREKRMMKALIFYWDEQHWPLAREALVKADRADLIGRAPHCLVPPDYGATASRGPARPATRPCGSSTTTPRRSPTRGGPGAGGGRRGR
ncbi:MAG: YgiQ family radical SAM protein [Myxococcales bacterium]|nr:YgiQ family radical SAM protein [Myxococcales bacterium]MBL0194619.1 YgiQ family radical SAM protein [Myxococcales bacterium]